MPSLENRRSDDSSLSDIFSKNEGAPLLMTVTESVSFGSGTAHTADLDGPGLSLSLSGESDSMGFDLKNSFEDDDLRRDSQHHTHSSSTDEIDSGTSVISAGTKDTTTTTTSSTQDSNIVRHSYPYPPGSYGGPPPSYGRPPYPHQYPHPYYGGHYPSQPPPNYHGYYRGYSHHPGYPPHPSYMLNSRHQASGKEGKHNVSNKTIPTASSRQNIKPSASSVSSVTSTESKKRTIDDISHDDKADFTIHRGSSQSICSAGTVTSALNPISKLVCESPIKRERTEPPVTSLERSESMESTESTLTFGGLSMTSHSAEDQAPPQKTVELDHYHNNDTKDYGVTPISKNTKAGKRENQYFFKENSAKVEPEKPLSSNIHFKGSESVSPDLSLDIKSQLSWNLVGDDLAETPVSLGSNISPTFWKSDGKSPRGENFFDDSSPVSLSDNLLSGASNSPIAVFFNGSSEEKLEPMPNIDQPQSVNRPPYPTPSSPMPPQSPYYQDPPPHHANMHDNFNPMHNNRHEGQPSYQSPRPMYRPPERIVNLRGQRLPNGAPHAAQTLHLPPHIPSHRHFLASPIGAPAPRSMMSPHHIMRSPYSQPSPHSNMSKRRCVPLKQPIPSKFQGDIEKYKNASIPEFTALVNFPAHMSQKQAVNLPEGMRCCVMCGQACRCSGSKGKKGPKKEEMPRKVNGQYSMIPTQNKGLCTSCDVNVWVVANSQLEIKWCKGCKNFRPWAAFGEKGLATKCVRCRDRQREKYAAQKEEKDKKKAMKNRK